MAGGEYRPGVDSCGCDFDLRSQAKMGWIGHAALRNFSVKDELYILLSCQDLNVLMDVALIPFSQSNYMSLALAYRVDYFIKIGLF